MAQTASRRRLLQGAASFAGLGVMAGSLPVAEAAVQAVRTSDHAAADKLYVVPAPPGQKPAGRGSPDSPFRLGSGSEYALNRLIRVSMEAERPLVVEFADGVYQDVRLQIIREGTDRKTLYKTTRVRHDGADEIVYPNTTECNRQHENCRVQDPDFAIGPTRCAPLLLRASNPGCAVFDGSGLDGPPAVDDMALVVSGAVFGAPGGACTVSDSPRISQVSVEGLSFRNYRNGIHVTYAEQVVIAGCHVENIGGRSQRGGNTQLIGTFALRVDGDSHTVLLRDNIVRNVWNVASLDGSHAGEHDPGLIHAIYQGYARDVVFLRNRFHGSSGPMVKFGFYASKHDGKLVCAYPSSPRERCTVLIGNHFELATMVDDGKAVPVYEAQQAFIEENSMELVEGKPTAPAAGVIVLHNSFVNTLPASIPVAFLRQEVLGNDHAVDIPGWIFADNVIEGIQPDYLVAIRQRGTPLASSSLRPGAGPDALRASLKQQLSSKQGPGDPFADGDQLPASIHDLQGPRNAGEDETLIHMAVSGMMPWQRELI